MICYWRWRSLWGYLVSGGSCLSRAGGWRAQGLCSDAGSGIAACLMGLPAASATFRLGFRVGDTPVQFHLGCRWMLALAVWSAPRALRRRAEHDGICRLPARRYWLAGLALTLLGALGVFGLQDAMSFLIAWEVMSVGGAVMILGEGVSESPGGPMLFMLSLLEVGAVAILLALLLSRQPRRFVSHSRVFAAPQAVSTRGTLVVGLLLLFGFGAKLGVLPFYEWFPAAYGSGSGATGVIFSGVVLNAAFYALARGVLQWLPHAGVWAMSVAIIMIIAGVLSAILAIFNAFQEEDWRRMLSLSSAENAGVAVAVLGVSLLFAVSRIAGARGDWHGSYACCTWRGTAWRRARYSSLPTACIPSMAAMSSGKPGCCEIRPSSSESARSLRR